MAIRSQQNILTILYYIFCFFRSVPQVNGVRDGNGHLHLMRERQLTQHEGVFYIPPSSQVVRVSTNNPSSQKHCKKKNTNIQKKHTQPRIASIQTHIHIKKCIYFVIRKECASSQNRTQDHKPTRNQKITHKHQKKKVYRQIRQRDIDCIVSMLKCDVDI